jgi:cytidyltransferase-like protein
MSKAKLVVASGFFNPVHVGHVRYLEYARLLGDRLIVIVNTDYQVRLKGSVPFMPEQERLDVVFALKPVDFAVLAIDKDRSVSKTLEVLRPDIFANGGDVTASNVRESEVCQRLGIKMVFGVGGTAKIQSSSSLIARVSERHGGIEDALARCKRWEMTDEEVEELLR